MNPSCDVGERYFVNTNSFPDLYNQQQSQSQRSPLKMEKLSHESIENILGCLEGQDLVNCAPVSNQFRTVVERHTFRDLKIKSTELDTFEKLFSDTRRRACLRELRFGAVLPEYAEKYSARFEREQDRSANNEAFSEAVASLFDILHSWESPTNGTDVHGHVNGHGITFELGAWAPSDPGHRKSEQAVPHDLEWRRWRRSFLKILDSNSIKPVHNITNFRARIDPRRYTGEIIDVRHVDPASAVSLARKIPNLERIDWSFWDGDELEQYIDDRRERRQSMWMINYMKGSLLICRLSFCSNAIQAPSTKPHTF